MPLSNLRKAMQKQEESQIPSKPGLAHASDGPEPNSEAIERSTQKMVMAIKAEPLVRKVVKKAARLADMITDDDRIKAKKAIVDAMDATNRNYDKDLGRFDIYPDHKTRLAAAALQLAYDEGTPVKRSITITSDFRSADEILSTLQKSPEASRAVQALAGLGLNLETEGEMINTIPETVNIEPEATEE